MPYNGSGSFSVLNVFLPNTTILSALVNGNCSDFATGLSTAMTKDGQQVATANIPMGNFKFTGMGAGSARTDSISLGQEQDGLVNWIVAGGAADAITATYAPAITALVDGQICSFRATAANATTTPTFAPNSLTARTITKKGGATVVTGDIAGNLAEVTLRYNLANTRWELVNPATVNLGSNALLFGSMINGTIVQSQSGNAQTFAIKTFAGADPSAGDPVTFLFRDATVATGDYLVRTVTAALNITIPSGQTMNFSNATPGRVWIGAIDNAGTVELFVFNAYTTSGIGTAQIYPLLGWGITSTSAVSGASASGVAYSTTARSSKPYVTIGYATWEAGGVLAVAGTWNVLATRLQIYQPGSVPLPGQPIAQFSAQTSSSTTINGANVQTALSLSITMTSSANVIEAIASFNFNVAAAGELIFRLSRGAGPTYFGNSLRTQNGGGGAEVFSGVVLGDDAPGTLGATTYYVYGTLIAGGNGTFNPTTPATIKVKEIMA